MRFFACAVRMDGGPVPASFSDTIARSRPMTQLGSHAGRGFLGLASADDFDGPIVARLGAAIGIGVVRLDNRAEVLRLLSRRDDDVSDLGLVMQFVTRDQGARIGRLEGDFSFVVWDPTSGCLLAARDTFGVRKLYYAGPRNGLITFCSHASPLAAGDSYDVQYLAERVSYCAPDPERTVYANVRALPAATALRVRNGTPLLSSYWSAEEAQARDHVALSQGDSVDAFRTMLMDAVRQRLTTDGRTWSHLSGGLDSSSVVSLSQWLAARGDTTHGLGGTVTFTDSLGTGADEKEYSDAVVQHWHVRNELVPHRVSRGDALIDPPLLDQPNRSFPAAARDCEAARVIERAGGRVLFTGLGGDNLALGTMFFFADWVVSGRLGHALAEMAHRAAMGRVSFWELAYRNALLPLLPAGLRRALTRGGEGDVPPWLTSEATKRFDIVSRTAHDQVYGGRLGHKYEQAQAALIAAIPSTLIDGPHEDALDVRHPYLHRPLVELSLRLPPELVVRPQQRKWILRESMRGILPEFVRTRIGKGEADGFDVWSLTHEQQYIDRLLEDPILGQLGCIDPKRLRDAVCAARDGRGSKTGSSSRIGGTLETELWLQLRSGRWAANCSQDGRSGKAK